MNQWDDFRVEKREDGDPDNTLKITKKERHELEQKRSEALKNIIYKNERHKLIILKNVFESWNLRAKIISLPKVDGLKKSVRKKKIKKKL